MSRAVALLLFVLALAVAVPRAAPAGTGVVVSVVGAEGGVFWRSSSPDWAAPIRNVGYGVYNGDQVELECWTIGSTVPPYWNNSLWYDAIVVAGRGLGEGFVNDHFLDTGVDQPNIVLAGVPQCGSAGDSGGSAGTDGGDTGSGGSSSPAASTVQTVFYDRAAAVSWAKAHARDGQAYGAMCTWFVSNALWSGGFPKDSTWTNQGRYTSAPGTRAAWVVSDFLDHLEQSFSLTVTDISSAFRTNAVPQAQPGDILAYDWGTGEGISHLAIVIDDAPGHYPQVAEWGQFNWTGLAGAWYHIRNPRSPYVKRGWTWSALHGKWLQQVYPQVKAYLIHING